MKFVCLLDEAYVTKLSIFDGRQDIDLITNMRDREYGRVRPASNTIYEQPVHNLVCFGHH